MKGPGLRIDLDVRRVWKCAKCGRIARTVGQVTALRCGCTEAVQWMHLETAVKKEPFHAPLREHLPEEWELEDAAEQTTVAGQLSVASGQSPVDSQPADVSQSAENPPQALEPPLASEPGPAEVLAIVVTESVAESVVLTETATEVSIPAPTAPLADTFGAGVEEPPRNPAET